MFTQLASKTTDPDSRTGGISVYCLCVLLALSRLDSVIYTCNFVIAYNV